MAGVEREFLAVADRLDAVGRDAERDEVVARGDRPPLAERQIVLGGAALVAVALDGDLPGRVPAQDVRIVLQYLLTLSVHFRRVKPKNTGFSGEFRLMSSIEPAAIESSATGSGGTGVGSGAGAGGSGGGVTVVEPDGGGGMGRATGGVFFPHAPAAMVTSSSNRNAVLRIDSVFIACTLLALISTNQGCSCCRPA